MDKNITDVEISVLRNDAVRAGDFAQVLICDIATGDEELNQPIESIRIAKFISARNILRIRSYFADMDSARAECARVICGRSEDMGVK